MVETISLRGTVPGPMCLQPPRPHCRSRITGKRKMDLTSCCLSSSFCLPLALPGTNKQQSTSKKPHKLSYQFFPTSIISKTHEATYYVVAGSHLSY